MIWNLTVFVLLSLFANSAFAWYRINGVVYPGHRHHAHREKPSRQSSSRVDRRKANPKASEEKPAEPAEPEISDTQEDGKAEDRPPSTADVPPQKEVIHADVTVGVDCQFEKSAGQLVLTLFKGTEVADGCPIVLFQTLPATLASGSKDSKPLITGTFNLILRRDVPDCHYVRAATNESDSQVAGNDETPNEVIRCVKK